MSGNFANSGRLTRFALRRERVNSTVWIVSVVLFSVALAAAMGPMFDDAARQALALTLDNPGIIAMMGPVYGADNYTVGAMYANTMLLWMAITVAIMNIFLVVRHTRADEENGRSELVRSLPSGRLAPMTATVATAIVVNLIMGVLHTVGIYAAASEYMDMRGCLLYGAAMAAIGLVFAAITAVFCQLCSTAGGALGYSFAALGGFYLLRGVGDISSETLSLISPLGLIQRTQVFVENDFWPIVVLLLETAALLAAAFWLCSIRDVGQGFIAAKPGKKEASRWLRSPLGLSWRLVKNASLIWLFSVFLLGATYGSIMGDIETFVDQSELYQMLIGVNDSYSVPVMFTSMVNCIMAFIAVVPVLTITLKLRSEEKAGRLEHVLTRSVSRLRYLLCFTAIAYVSSFFFQCATAVGLYASASAVLEENIALDLLLKGSLVYLPALWVMIGIAVLLTGILPKLTGVIWGYYGFSFAITFVGRSLDIPEWLVKLTPFGWVPQLPIDSINYAVLAGLTAVALLLTAVGFVCYARRDAAL